MGSHDELTEEQRDLYREINAELASINVALEDQLRLTVATKVAQEQSTLSTLQMAQQVNDAVAAAGARSASYYAGAASGHRRVREEAGEDIEVGDFVARDGRSARDHIEAVGAGYDEFLGKIDNMAARYKDLYRGIQDLFGGGMDLFQQAQGESERLIDITELAIKQFAGAIDEQYKIGRIGLQGIFESEQELLEVFEEVTTQSINTHAMIRDATDDTVVQLALLSRGTGLSAEQTSTFVQRQISLTGEAGTEMLDEAAFFAKQMEARFDISAKQVMGRVEDIISSTERFGNVTVEEAARIGAALYQVGLDVSELGNMLGQFQGFQNAASAVGDLTAVFGINVDAMEMMMLANTDQEQFLYRMREAFMETGQSVEDMNLAQKQLIKDQLGLSDIEAVERLLGPMGSALEDMEGMADATDEYDPGEGLSAVREDILLLADASEASGDQIAESFKLAMGAETNRTLVNFQGHMAMAGHAIRQELGENTQAVIRSTGASLNDAFGVDVAGEGADFLRALPEVLGSYSDMLEELLSAAPPDEMERQQDVLEEMRGSFETPIEGNALSEALDNATESFERLEASADYFRRRSDSPAETDMRETTEGMTASVVSSARQMTDAFSEIDIADNFQSQAQRIQQDMGDALVYLEGQAGSGLFDPGALSELGVSEEEIATIRSVMEGGGDARAAIQELTAARIAELTGEDEEEGEGGGAGGRGRGRGRGSSRGPFTFQLFLDSSMIAEAITNETNLEGVIRAITRQGAGPGGTTIELTEPA